MTLPTGAPRVLLAPSILSADFARLGEEVQAAEAAGADWIHVDVMDGHFVPNLTLGPAITEAVRRHTSLPVDVHLMIEAPERFLEPFVEAGADRITVHHEACPHLHRVLERIRELGALPGVAVNPATPVEVLRDVLPFVELVLVMTVNPGFGGQTFIPTSPGRVARLRALLEEHRRGEAVALQVDGGVDVRSAGAVVAAGADVLVAGSAVYGHPDGVAEAIRGLRQAAAEGVPFPRGGETVSASAPLLDPAAFQRLREWGGDELLGKIVSLFLEHAPSRLAEVEAGAEEGNLDRVERGAHALKSSAANVGGVALQRAAAGLEEAAGAGELEAVARLLPGFRAAFRQTVEALGRHGPPVTPGIESQGEER